MAELKRSIIAQIFSTGPVKCNLDADQNDVKKSDVEAEKIRLEGNSYFKANNLEASIESYTKSLCFARSHESKGKALGNRSACFFQLYMFDWCIKDIELAQKHDYSTQTLDSRRMKSLLIMSQITLRDKFSLKEVREEPNKQMPDALYCKYDSYFGRGLYAARDILKGETILVEDPFVCVNMPDSCYQKCDFCWKSIGTFIPCPQCAETVFCDSKCMEAAHWYHKYECGKNKKFNTPIRQELQSVFYGIECFHSVHELWDFFSNIVLKGDVGGCSQIPDIWSDPRSKYAFFLKLGTSKQKGWIDFDYPRYLEEITVRFYMNKSWLRKYSAEEQCQLQRIFLYNFHIINENSFGIYKRLGDHSVQSGMCYLMASLFNHNCAPNAKHSFKGNRIIVTAAKDIKKDEQVFVKYIDSDVNVMTTTCRRKYLKEAFGFDCRCELCSFSNMKI